mmetsp:Transcript_17135/g.46473  ORF Transcript_17135/g.46473 Transcript_17135/m.46473 type:complete len:325 (+) Transcript_17135:227-1201(+)
MLMAISATRNACLRSACHSTPGSAAPRRPAISSPCCCSVFTITSISLRASRSASRRCRSHAAISSTARRWFRACVASPWRSRSPAKVTLRAQRLSISKRSSSAKTARPCLSASAPAAHRRTSCSGARTQRLAARAATRRRSGCSSARGWPKSRSSSRLRPARPSGVRACFASGSARGMARSPRRTPSWWRPRSRSAWCRWSLRGPRPSHRSWLTRACCRWRPPRDEVLRDARPVDECYRPLLAALQVARERPGPPPARLPRLALAWTCAGRTSRGGRERHNCAERMCLRSLVLVERKGRPEWRPEGACECFVRKWKRCGCKWYG